MNNDRRNFLKKIVATSAAIPFSNHLFSMAEISNKKKYPIYFFSKPLDKFGYDFITDTLKMAGVDGIDLTVRPRGLVLPEKVEDDLPKVVDIAKKNGLLTELMVSNLKGVNTLHAENVLKVAANCGIKHYRLGYFKYSKNESVSQTIARAKSGMLSLTKINRELGIQGGYQNHTGNYFGSPVWDLIKVLESMPTRWMTSQFDIYHAFAEGYKSWVITMDMIAPKIGSLAIKDFTWQKTDGKLKMKKVPLGKGIVDLDGFFINLKKLKIYAPITLHIEYPILLDKEKNFSILQKQKAIVNKIKNDIGFIRLKLKQHQLV